MNRFLARTALTALAFAAAPQNGPHIASGGCPICTGAVATYTR